MDKKLNEQYESPQVEVIEVEVEKGFATSSYDTYDLEDGGGYGRS